MVPDKSWRSALLSPVSAASWARLRNSFPASDAGAVASAA